MAFVDYKAYLASAEWRHRRNAAVARADGRCQMCYSEKNLQVHHRTYDRLGCELPTDLTVLCRACHMKHHDINQPAPASVKAASKPKPKGRSKQTTGPLTVACPHCEARRGKPCRSESNKIIKVHHSRRVLADGGVPVVKKPKAYSVECPSCFAPVGKACYLKNRIHWDRTELALGPA